MPRVVTRRGEVSGAGAVVKHQATVKTPVHRRLFLASPGTAVDEPQLATHDVPGAVVVHRSRHEPARRGFPAEMRLPIGHVDVPAGVELYGDVARPAEPPGGRGEGEQGE